MGAASLRLTSRIHYPNTQSVVLEMLIDQPNDVEPPEGGYAWYAGI